MLPGKPHNTYTNTYACTCSHDMRYGMHVPAIPQPLAHAAVACAGFPLLLTASETSTRESRGLQRRHSPACAPRPGGHDTASWARRSWSAGKSSPGRTHKAHRVCRGMAPKGKRGGGSKGKDVCSGKALLLGAGHRYRGPHVADAMHQCRDAVRSNALHLTAASALPSPCWDPYGLPRPASPC